MTDAAAVATALSDQVTGKLKWYDAAKGYGFITRPDGGRDVFLHVKELRKSGIIALNDGVSLRFRYQEGAKGPYAVDIKILPGSTG